MSETNQKEKNVQQGRPENQTDMSWEMNALRVERRMMERTFQRIGQRTDVKTQFRDPAKGERFQFPEFKSGEVLKALNDLKARGFKTVVVQSENSEFMRRVGLMTESLGMGTNVRLSTAERLVVRHIRETNPWTLVNLGRQNEHDNSRVQ